MVGGSGNMPPGTPSRSGIDSPSKGMRFALQTAAVEISRYSGSASSRPVARRSAPTHGHDLRTEVTDQRLAAVQLPHGVEQLVEQR